MFFAACVLTVLGLVSSSLATPLSCQKVMQHARREELPPLYGEWPAVACTVGINHRKSMTTQISESFSLHYNNVTFLTTKRQRGVCINQPYNAPLRGVTFHDTLRSRDDVEGRPGYTTFKGTIFRTSCRDCLLMTFNIASPTYNVNTLTLYSKRRQVTDEELQEFHTLAKCLNLPEGFEMDPTIPLCPVTMQDFYGSK